MNYELFRANIASVILNLVQDLCPYLHIRHFDWNEGGMEKSLKLFSPCFKGRFPI